MALSSESATSSQSSTDGTHNSSLAQDGLTTTYSLTADTSPSWSVNLANAGYVHQVTLVVDSSGCNLQGAVMTLKDSSNNIVATRTLSGCGQAGFVDEYFAPACTCE